MPSNILLSDSITSKALASDQSSDSSKFSLSGQNNVPSKNISNYSVNFSSEIPYSVLSSDPTLLPSYIPSSDQIALAYWRNISHMLVIDLQRDKCGTAN